MSEADAAIMREQGGYSGPQLFHRTASLVKKYRRILDLPLHGQNESHQTQLQPQEDMAMRIEATVKRDEANLKDFPNRSIDQPLLHVPERHTSSATDGTAADSAPALSASHHHEQLSTSEVSEPAKLIPKVIFCTGGVENGQQALEVLNAGASVAQIYSKSDLFTTGVAFANAQCSSSCLRRCGENHLYEAGNEEYYSRASRVRCARKIDEQSWRLFKKKIPWTFNTLEPGTLTTA